MSDYSSAPRLPLSPASPPESGVKQQSKYYVPAVTPQTPPSPDSMSVATKRYVSSSHTNEMANRSPDSYVAQSQRTSINSTTSTSHQPNTLKRPLSPDENERPSSKRQKQEIVEDGMEVDTSLTATNHDRQEQNAQPNISQSITSATESAVQEDAPGIASADLDPIFKNVDPSFAIGKTTHKHATVDLNQHMLGKYGLHSLLASVARYEPGTDNKINKLRKSYEGQIKNAALPGKNKPYQEPRSEDQPSRLRLMATIPEEEFRAEQSDRRIGDLTGLQDTMRKALSLGAANMNKETMQEWDKIMGHEPILPAKPQQLAYQQTQQARVPNGIKTPKFVQPAAPDKMKTRGKKRSYDDSAFPGYTSYPGAQYDSDVEVDHDPDGDYADRGKKRRKD